MNYTYSQDALGLLSSNLTIFSNSLQYCDTLNEAIPWHLPITTCTSKQFSCLMNCFYYFQFIHSVSHNITIILAADQINVFGDVCKLENAMQWGIKWQVKTHKIHCYTYICMMKRSIHTVAYLLWGLVGHLSY